jgi:hypothetical protein
MDPFAMIRLRRKTIAQAMKALEIEDAELEQAERTIARLTKVKKPKASQDTQLFPKTQKDYVVATLDESQNPWFDSIKTLRDEIEKKYGKNIKLTSLQPLVSDMTRREKLVVRDGLKLASAARIKG